MLINWTSLRNDNLLDPQLEPLLYCCLVAKSCPTLLLPQGFPDGSVVKILPAMQEMQEMEFQSLGQEDTLEKKMATLFQYSCLLEKELGNPLQYSCLENPRDGGA